MAGRKGRPLGPVGDRGRRRARMRTRYRLRPAPSGCGPRRIEGRFAVGRSARRSWCASGSAMASRYLDELVRYHQDSNFPSEFRSLGRTLKRWRHQITSPGPTLEPRTGPPRGQPPSSSDSRRAPDFRRYRIRSVVYAGRTHRALLATITPALKSEAPVSLTHQVHGSSWRSDLLSTRAVLCSR